MAALLRQSKSTSGVKNGMAIKNEEQLKPIAEILLPILQALRGNPTNEMRAWAIAVLDLACRQVEIFIEPEVSERAQEEATHLGLGCLRQYCWSDQPSKMGDVGRKIFHWEHMLPVAEMKRQLIALNPPTTEAIHSILTQANVAWILKEEDQTLTRLNLAHRRPDGPLVAYEKANIKLLSFS